MGCVSRELLEVWQLSGVVGNIIILVEGETKDKMFLGLVAKQPLYKYDEITRRINDTTRLTILKDSNFHLAIFYVDEIESLHKMEIEH